MVRRALVVLCVGFVCMFAASCGQTFDLQSITVAPASPNVEGLGGTQTLTVTAHFSNTKTEDVTAQSTFQWVTSPAPFSLTLTHNVIQAVDGDCTWAAEPIDPPTDSKFSYFLLNPYQLTVSFTKDGVTKTAQVFVAVASSADCYDGQSYLAPTGFTGTPLPPSP